MNILIIGSGGREHAFTWKIKQSHLCDNLFIAPGNAGTASCGTNVAIGINDFEALATFSIENNVGLILVGPEEPLVNGIVDYFKNGATTKHIKIIGPSKEAAQLEGSKAYSKNFMQRHQIPTAGYREFTADNFDEGMEYIGQHSLPIVLKADGLAAGKGVLICMSVQEAKAEFEQMILQQKFGTASSKVVIEEFLQGIEMSVFVLTDGKNYELLPEAKDYKRIGEGDTGLNTGGMGAVSPVPIMNNILKERIIKKIVEPTINGFAKDNLDYKGFVFIGLMINDNEPFVIEYNCRMGDPETEVVIPRLKNDLVEMLIATADENIQSIKIETDKRQAVATVAVSAGYPGDYEKGKSITGLVENNDHENLLFHAGTSQSGDEIVTNGGRVLVAVSFADTIKDAAAKSSKTLENISFDGIGFRRDIGYEFMG
jgi:phosphoribosylamine---glycine ligase